jgi:K+-sensing histidine kinase KdpD
VPAGVVEVKKHEASRTPDELAALDVIGRFAGESADLAEILSTALDKVSEILDVEIAYVSLLDQEAGELGPLAFGTACEEISRQASELELGRELAQRVARTEQSVVEEMSVDRQLEGRLAGEPQVRSYAGFPLKSRGRVLGVMSVARRDPPRFTMADLAFLSALAGQLGAVVENSLLHEDLDSSQFRLRERVKELHILYDVSREALLSPDPDAFLAYVARRLPASMQYQRAAAVVCCNVGGRVHLAWSDNLDAGVAEQLCVVPGEGTLGKLLADQGVLLEYEISRLDPVWADCDVKSILAVTVAVNGENVGSVGVYYLSEEWRFLEEEKDLLRGISEQIAQYLTKDAIEREKRLRAQEVSTLFEVSKALASVVELRELLPAISDTLIETLEPSDAGALLLFDKTTGMLTIESGYGYDMSALYRISLAVGESMSGRVFQSGIPAVWATPEECASAMANMTAHNRAHFEQALGGLEHPRSAIGVPLIYRDEKMGVLTLETLSGDARLSASHLPFLQALAELIVINLNQVRLLQETEQARAAEEADRLKSELIAALAHDMRTPLTSIQGYASALLLSDVEWDEESRVRHLQIIDEEARDLHTMIEDLLESSIIDAGLLALEKEPTLIPRLVEGLVGEMTRRTAKHRFVIGFPSDFPIVDADPRRIEQVLRNLLDNAVKYSPDGGLVVVRGQVAGDEAIVSVADNGARLGVQAWYFPFLALSSRAMRGGSGPKAS